MHSLVEEALEQYCLEHSTPDSNLFQQITEETHQSTDLPQMLTGNIEGTLLKLLVQISGAKLALEIGTFTGYSALKIAEGLPLDGKIITCDISEKYTDIAKEFWSRSTHLPKIELRLAPALETIDKISEPLDFVFIDADKENYSNYWESCIPKVRSGGIIVADNVLWSGRVLNPSKKSDKAIHAFNTLVKQDKRVEQVLLSVRDGITIARKK